MPDIVTLRAHDCTYDRIVADPGILQEIIDRFTFYAEKYKFHPKYKARVWDGKIRLLSPFNPYLYSGLRDEVRKFCENSGYELKYDGIDPAENPFSLVEAEEFIRNLGLPETLNGLPVDIRDYQVAAFAKAVRRKRATLICPTASGKSLIAYAIVRYFDKKTLIIVPNLNLINQLKSDFVEYGYDPSLIHQIYSGQDKVTDHPVTVSTWQSLKGISKEYLSRFDVLVVDEVHGAKAKELKETVEKMVNCQVKVGLSGTLDGLQVNELTISGLFGPIDQVTTTRELIDRGYLASLKIKSILLQHTDENKKLLYKAKYPDEMKYLIGSESRNRFIVNLALSLKGNTLILFQFVELHGEPLHTLIEEAADCPVLYVSGKVESDEREEVRKFVNTQTRSITVASKGTFSTGVNIPNLNNIIFASPSKARIGIMQSIGRGLRKSDRKDDFALFDIADDLSKGSWVNHTLGHYVERTKMYRTERFEHRAYPVKLKG